VAGSEVYRVEIPIIVDDQSEAPLTKARERVNKFEQAAQKTNQSIQRMAMTDYRLRLSVLDKASPVLDKVGRTLKTMTTRAWNVTVGVKDKVTGFFGRIGRMLKTPLGMIGMGGLTLGPMALISSAIKIAGEFEQAMANVQSVAGASQEEMDRLREAAAKAGRETVFKASEAADALYYLALAGFNVDQQIGALSGTLALAAATQSDLAFTSETVASTISAFGLEAEEADRVANVFAATISSSQASMEKLAQSMRYAGPAAAGFGRSLEETAATLALFYNMGLTGEMAGTRFRTALSALAHPTGDTKKALAELGIKASQVNPAMHSLADIIDLLKAKGVDTAMAMRIFGQETGPAMASLIALGGKALRDMERQITGTNKALEMQEIQLDTLMGAQKELQSVWEAVNITLGTQSIPGLRRLVEWFKQAIGNAEELAKNIGDKLNRAFEWLADILESPEFREATFADKIKILFTAAIDEITAWLGSSGKEQLSKVFVTLGEESVKAYISGMKALGQRAIQELKQGNVAGAAVPAAAMWFLGGGALARGIWGLGKGLFGAGKWALGKAVGTAAATGTTAAATTAAATTAATAATAAGTKLIYGPSGEILRVVAPAATAAGTTSRTLAMLGKVNQVMLPLAVAGEVISIATAQDKAYATAQSVGGLAGLLAGKLGGAKLGAALGTAIAPGIGTAIGGVLGGFVGYLGGRFLGGKAVEAFKGSREHPGAPADSTQFMQPMAEAANKVSAILGSFSVYLQGQADAVIFNLTQLSEQAWNITAIKTAFAKNLQSQATAVISNMEQMGQQTRRIVAIETAFAANLQGVANSIVANGKSLANALALAAARAATFQLPSISLPSFTPTPHATGSILTRPHLGLVAEAGPEAIIPLSARMRARAMDLWLETGRRLGVRPYAEGGFAGALTQNREQKIPVSFTPSLAMLGPATVNLNFDLAGLVSQVVIDNRDDIDNAIDKITDAIANNLRAVFQNMTK